MSTKVRSLIKYRRFSLLCLFASIPLCFIGAVFESALICVSGISLLVLFIAISLIFWRCPHCKEGSPMSFNINKDIDEVYNCPYCNGKIE
ncbi:hypothetical protein [Clostridium sp.]|uniref:hypothetical protein n=1 Tax=Clostridium sp. TaxID=1506 RepID=UPI0032176F24